MLTQTKMEVCSSLIFKSCSQHAEGISNYPLCLTMEGGGGRTTIKSTCWILVNPSECIHAVSYLTLITFSVIDLKRPRWQLKHFWRNPADIESVNSFCDIPREGGRSHCTERHDTDCNLLKELCDTHKSWRNSNTHISQKAQKEELPQ